MNLLKLIKLHPKILKKYKSNFNKEIYVVKNRNEISIIIDDLAQSGPVLERIWHQALKQIDLLPQNLLLLGAGCGSALYEAKKKWPKIKLTAVEIDPVMIQIASKYYPNNFGKTEIIIGDATKRVNLIYNKYDLILIDLYKGKKYPQEASNLKFFKRIKFLLSKKGICIINRVSYQNKNELNEFKTKLHQVFDQVMLKKNALIFPSNFFLVAR